MLNQNQANGMAIDKAFEPYIKRVLETHSFGVTRRNIQMNYCTSSQKTKADRFALSIPYAGQTLDWIVLFDSNCPDLGPDFHFHNDVFLADPDVEVIENHVPSLANWQPTDPEALLKVLTELIKLYHQHQIDLLKSQEERLFCEYEMIVGQTGVRVEDMEVFLSPNELSPNEAKFFIRLDIDFSRLPGRCNKVTQDQAMLVINFNPPNCSRVVPQLFLSLPLEATLGEPGKQQIPPFPRDGCVADYLPEVKKVIDGKIDEVAELFGLKRNYIAAVFILQRRNVIEYDAINFNRIDILLEHEDFHFLVKFDLSVNFPKEKPAVYLQSIYHMTKNDELPKIRVKEFPYNLRWTPLVMVTKVLNAIILCNEVQHLKSSTLNNFLNSR